jgi:hypothetical protein
MSDLKSNIDIENNHYFDNLLESIKLINLENECSIQSLNSLLIKLSDLIKSDINVRLIYTESLYFVLNEKLNDAINNIKIKNDYSRISWCSLSLIMRCLKNSSAAFRDYMNATEKKICRFLNIIISDNINYFMLEYKSNQKNETLVNKFNFYKNSFEYFYNLIVGKC